MAPPPTADFANIVIEWQGANQAFPGATVIGCAAETVNTATLTDLALLLADFYDVCWDSTTEDISASLKVGPGPTGPTFEIQTGLSGGRGGAPAAPNVSLLMEKRILDVSGRFAGRNFLPAPLESEVADRGLLTAGSFLAYEAAVTDLYDGLVAIGFPPYVFSASSSDPRAVDSFGVDRKVATQRRRMRR